ncbi:TPA: hypothetical protein ACX6RP_003418 [Photobacterium damselae]
MSILSYINLSVFASGLFPLFVLIFFYKMTQPKYHGNWIFGVIFIMVACFLAGTLNILQGFIINYVDKPDEVNDATFTIELWLYIVPASIAAIGVNLISHYLITTKS